MNRINQVIRKIFPNEFEELVPMRKRWWHRLDFSFLKTKWAILVVGLSLTIATLACIYYYNRFVVLETNATTDFEQIKVHLQRRKDLMINLTRTVIDYARHERAMFTYMADKRSDSMNTSNTLMDAIKDGRILEKIKAGQEGEALAKLMALAEAYPELKLSSNFQKFMDALVDIENKIVERRMIYNQSANIYGTYVRQFPQILYARLFKYKPAMFPYVKVDADVADFNRIKY